MKNDVLEYKGYYARIEFDAEEAVLRGKIEGIADLVNFENSDAAQIAEEFHAAVDDYLLFCEETGKEPDKAYRGTFNVRIAPELHKKLAIAALHSGESLNATVEKAVWEYISNIEEREKQRQNLVKVYSKAIKRGIVFQRERSGSRLLRRVFRPAAADCR